MKNKKLIKAIAATIVCSTMGIAAFSFTACDPDSGNTKHTHSYTWVDDENGTTHHEHCGVDGCDAPDKASVNHVDKNNDNVCDDCKAHVHAFSPSWTYDLNKHWHVATCDHKDQVADEGEHELDSEGKCSVCDVLIASYEFLAADHEATTSLAKDLISGIFTVCQGTAIRTRTKENVYVENDKVLDVVYTKSVKLNGSSAKIQINAPAAGELVLHIQNGSTGDVPRQSITVKGPGGATKAVTYAGSTCSNMTQLVKIDLTEKGVYEITPTSGTSDIYYMSFRAIVEDTPIKKIEVVAKGKDSYYVGQDISYEGIAVNAVHEDTGRVSPVPTSALTIVSSDYDKTKAGTYTVNISYTVDGKTFETSYPVTVYTLGSLKLGTDTVKLSDKNSAAGNGVYENHTLRQLYFVGETVSSDGLSVILSSSDGENTHEFLLKSDEYSLSEVNTNTPGKKEVTVTVESNGASVTETFNIYVVSKDDSLATATSVSLTVDAATTDENVGVNNGGVYQFQTIHQALDFLNNSGVQDTATKTINLAAGTYWEKLEINVPNLTIIGAGKDKTMIEYDSLYGIKDAGGFEHVTDSTATMNVRDKAVNFTIKGVTVSNWYNSLARFDEKLGKEYPEHRALALLVQSDKFIMDDCALLGYQDTVQFFTGRQYILNSYIEGTTDFIFGTNNTTYFENCEIHSISNGKTDGGYITAFKGYNKGKDDYVTYGAIFDKCHFTADSEVVKNKNTAIGRCWGAYAAVAVINSEIDGHVSLSAFTGASKNQRYVSMNGKPTDETVKFREYNNTGAGALVYTAADEEKDPTHVAGTPYEVDGMKLLSETDAAKYSQFTTIFGTTNGKVTYSSAWIPVKPGSETHSVTVVIKDGEELGSFTVEDGKAVLLDQIQALLLESDTYKEYEIKGVYSNEECTTDYTYPNVSGDDTIYIEIEKTKVSIGLKDVTLVEYTDDEGQKVTTVDIINEKYGDNITWAGSGWLEKDKPENGVKIGTDTVITVNVVGEVTLVAGYELPETDYVIIYKDGKATIKFVAATGQWGTYLGGINVDLTKTPEDSVFYTVTIDYDDEATEPVVKDDVVGGSKILKPTDPKRDGYTFQYWYVDGDDSTAYDFSTPVTGNITLKAKWEAGTKEYQTITSSTSASDAKLQRNGNGVLVGNEEYFNVEGTWGANGGHPLFKEGCKISFYVTAGATINFHAYYSQGANYTFKAVVDGKEIVGQVKTADSSDYTVSFSVESILLDAEGNAVDITGVDRILIEVTATGNAYCDYIMVTY